MKKDISIPLDKLTKVQFVKIHPWLFTLCVLMSLLGCVFLAEITPRFIDLPIPPPDYYKGGLAGNWMNESRSVITIPPTIVPDSRVFIERKEAIVSYDDSRHLTSWDSIVKYFDQKLDQLGWIRSETYAPCNIFLAEAKFLPENTRNGYVYYRMKKYQAFSDPEDSAVICLAIWPSSSDTYNVVLITARPSFLTILIDSIL